MKNGVLFEDLIDSNFTIHDASFVTHNILQALYWRPKIAFHCFHLLDNSSTGVI
jgi:hypothetical protein